MDRNTDAVLEAASALVDQAHRMLGDQLKVVEDEAGRLERANGHLNGRGTRTPASRRAPRRPSKSKEEREQQIVAELAKAPGTIGELTLRLGLPNRSTTLFGPASSAFDKGLVQKEGAVYSLPPMAKRKARPGGSRKSRSATKTPRPARKPE